MAGPRSLHVVSSLRLSSGGPTHSVPRLCQALQESGAPAELATTFAPGEASQKVEAFPCHAFPLQGPREWRRSPALAAFLEAEARRFDLIHVHGLWQWPPLAARRAASRAGLPLVISPRGMLEPWALAQRGWAKRLALATWEGRNLRQAALLHATSEAEALQFRKLGFENPGGVIPNGVDFPDLPPRALGHGPRRILFLSRFHPKKGVDLLLQAWAHLQGKFLPWRLDLAGPDPEGFRPAYEAQARALGLSPERVRFLEAQEGPAKWETLASADLLVLPSHSENFGNVVLEALACGVPVLTTTGTPWQGLQARSCGWWVPPNPSALEQALREALSMPLEELREVGRRGKAWSREFAWEAVASSMVQAYQQLLSKDHP